MKRIIDVNGLAKSFGDVEAVKGIAFYVNQGSLFAFLGPNGAGKSTTIDILTTLLKPDRGEVEVNGYRLGKEDKGIRSSIGVVFQGSLLDPLLTVEENLLIRGSFYGLSRQALRAALDRACEIVQAGEFMRRPYGRLSGGQRRRADIARALIHTPSILFLDEPTTGLDPQTRQHVWDTIRQLQREQGMTLFLTTHYMEEAAQADYITVMDHGLIKAQGTPLQLKADYASDMLKIMPAQPDELSGYLSGKAIPFTVDGGIYCIPLRRTTDALAIIDDCRANINHLEIVSGTMDDVFMNLTGREVRNP